MRIKEFEQKHVQSINKWLKKRQHTLATWKELPAAGWIVEGVAAGFLRKVEGNILIMDSFVTNPLCKSQTRNAALNAIIDGMMRHDCKAFWVFTTNIDTLERAKSRKFEHLPHSVLVLAK